MCCCDLNRNDYRERKGEFYKDLVFGKDLWSSGKVLEGPGSIPVQGRTFFFEIIYIFLEV